MTDRKRGLVVDDESDMRDYLSAFFSDNGYAVETAEDGVAALAKVEAGAPDLITLDVTMPEKSGVKFYREMKEDETRRAIPVIMITTKDQESDKVWGMRQGSVEYIVKPVTGKDLAAKINSVMAA